MLGTESFLKDVTFSFSTSWWTSRTSAKTQTAQWTRSQHSLIKLQELKTWFPKLTPNKGQFETVTPWKKAAAWQGTRLKATCRHALQPLKPGIIGILLEDKAVINLGMREIQYGRTKTKFSTKSKREAWLHQQYLWIKERLKSTCFK